MRTQTTVSRSKLRRRAASIAVGAALGVVAAAPMAAIIDSGPISIAVPANIDGIYMNWVTGVTGTLGSSVPGWDFDPFAGSAPANPTLFFFSSIVAGNTTRVVGALTTATALAVGAVIGPGIILTTAGAVNTTGTAFRNTGTTYVGIVFSNEAAVTYYGYAQLATTAPLGFPVTITRYVYENTGQPITIAGGAPPVEQSAVSRKDQGGTNFDLLLP